VKATAGWKAPGTGLWSDQVMSGIRAKLVPFMRDKSEIDQPVKCGPFVTISRQYACPGYFLGLLLVDLLNKNEPGEENPWRVYQREILDRLAKDTNLPIEELNRLRREPPRMLIDFFRNLGNKGLDGFEVRNRIAEVIRRAAVEGHIILIGMGGAGATAELQNGLRIRLEAPKEWRVQRIVEMEGISHVEARLLLQRHDAEREHLRRLYAMRFPHEPVFDLVYDCSTFTLAQLTQHVLGAMKLKKMV
jgi:cytidylate kinase